MAELPSKMSRGRFLAGASHSDQPALFNFSDDAALLLPPEEARKHYSGKIIDKLDWKRNAILMLLGAGFPVLTIKNELGVGQETVVELAKRSAEKVSDFNKSFASILLSTGARWVGLARTKENEASFKDVMIGAGIVMQHARELQAMGTGLDGEKEFVKEGENHLAAVARLKAWFLEQGLDVDESEPKAAPKLAGTPQQVVSCGIKPATEPNISLDDTKQT